MLATKFISWNIAELENLKGTKPYILKEKIEKNGKLDRIEKDFITERINNNSYFKNAIPLQGWKFDFSKIFPVIPPQKFP